MSDNHSCRPEGADRATGRRELPSRWGYFCSAVLSLATVVLLFQPWLSATGPNGTVDSNAFGRLTGMTLNNRGSSWTGEVAISGFWAVLASTAAVLTVFSVMLYLRARSESTSRLVVGSSTATAVFVLAMLMYLNGKASELRTLTEAGSVGGLKGILNTLFGTGANNSGSAYQVASASLTGTALLGGFVALGAACTAIASGLSKSAGNPVSPSPIAEAPVSAVPVTAFQVPAHLGAAHHGYRDNIDFSAVVKPEIAVADMRSNHSLGHTGPMRSVRKHSRPVPVGAPQPVSPEDKHPRRPGNPQASQSRARQLRRSIRPSRIG